jgi:ABC-type nitrate/sulfonate/bicarbonate transport system substrate-binding protein
MIRKISRRTWLAGATAAIATPCVSRYDRAIAATDLKFALPWIPHGGYAFLFAAKNLGAWSNRGLWRFSFPIASS